MEFIFKMESENKPKTKQNEQNCEKRDQLY